MFRTPLAIVFACSTLGTASSQAPDRGTLAWGDLDGDGLLDAVVLAPGLRDRVLLNLGDGSFLDVTTEVGLPPGSSSEAHWKDVDVDGDLDLLLIGSRPRLRLVVNDGGVLRKATSESGLTSMPGESTATFPDYDGDGLPDLALTGVNETRLFRNLGAARFEPVKLGELVPVSGDEAPSWLAWSNPPEPRAPETGPDEAPRPTGHASGGSRPSGVPVSGSAGAPAALAGSMTPSLVPLQPACTPGLADFAQPGACLSASSVPALGRLFPISESLFVDPSGKVGIGTTTPALELEVNGPLQSDGQNSGSGPHNAAVKGLGFPAGAQDVNGYLGVEGDTDYDGVTTADWSGLEIGVVGIGKDSISGDNYGVLGHSNGVGVRGEYSASPSTSYGELGLSDVGVRARGNSLAGEFLGNVELNDTGGAASPRLRISKAGGATLGTLGFQDALDDLELRNENGDLSLVLTETGLMHLTDDTDFATVRVSTGPGAFTSLWNAAHARTITLDANGDNDEGTLTLYDASGTQTLHLEAAEGSTGAQILMETDSGTATIELDAEFGDGGGGNIFLRSSTGTGTITLNGESGRTTTKILSITGGADIAEPFESSGGALEPGTVVAIDPDPAQVGRLRSSSEPYDRRVAGVVSGAGGVNAGLTLAQPGTLADGEFPVALTGRVFVRCSAENGPIRPGDRLTTAGLAGHAMKATDLARSDGAVLGKAMTALDQGTGLVLVLVNLQ